MKLFTMMLAFVCLLAGEDKPAPKYLSAADALTFAENAAFSIQQENEVNKAQVELERARVKVEQKISIARQDQEAYNAALLELRKKAAVAAECNVEATGKSDPDQKYQWTCPPSPNKK